MKTSTTSRLMTEACTPCRIESAPSEGPTVRSSRYLIDAGSAPERSTRPRSFASCSPNWPVDHAGIIDAAVDDRRGLHLVLEHDAQLLADVLFGEGAKAAARFGGKREIHIVEAEVFRAAHSGGAAQVAPGDNGHAVDHIPALAGSLAGADAELFP